MATTLSIVRENLLNQPGYTPYCGANYCAKRMPRTTFNGKQFECACGWQSNYEETFICDYKQKWGIK